MLATAGLAEGEDYETVLLDGFDPLDPHRARRHRRVPRLQEQRAGHARTGRHRLRPLRPDRLRHPRLVRRDLHDAGVPRRAPDRGRRTSCGPRCGGSPTPSPIPRPPSRPPMDLIDGGRQPELPVAGGRDVPLADRRRAADRRATPDGDRLGVPDAAAAAGRGRRLRRGRPVRRRTGAPTHRARRRRPRSRPSTTATR